VKVRQPLGEAIVVAAERERTAIERFQDLVLDELNVKALRFVSEADELGSYELKPNYRTLGPRFGKSMPQVANAVEALDAGKVTATLRDGGTVGVSIDGHDHELSADDLAISLQPLEGFQVEREAGHAVALELGISDELRREGLAREVVRAVQNERKDAGLDVSDRISLSLDGSSELMEAVREHESYITGEVLAARIDYGIDGESSSTTIDDHWLLIDVERAR
jgi:isoleucyl-tRNA synthetase